MSKEDDYEKSLDEFIQSPQKKNICINALKEIIPTPKNYVGFSLSLFIGIFLSLTIALQTNTVSIVVNICDKLIDIQLGIFSSILAVYSIVLVFLDDKYTGVLATTNNEKGETELYSSLRYLESVLYLYFVGLFWSVSYFFICSSLNDNFVLFNDNTVNEFFCLVLLLPYFTYGLRIIWEIKSIIFNTMILLKCSVILKIINMKSNNFQKK